MELDETEMELAEAGHGDPDRSRYDGSPTDSVYQWGVMLPGQDEAAIMELIGDMDITYALASEAWENTVFTGTLEDLTALRARIMGEEHAEN